MICYTCGAESANKDISGVRSVSVGGCVYCGKESVPLYPLHLFFVAGRYQVKRKQFDFSKVKGKDWK